MLLSRQDFLEEDGIVTFIGPSGAGKSGRSAALAKEWNCDRFEVDSEIGKTKAIRNALKPIDGKDAAEKMGKWMGMPWAKHHREREKTYLDAEKHVMKRIMRTAGAYRSLIIDTSGSGVYHPLEMQALKRGSLMVYLKPDEDLCDTMLQQYLAHPKPVSFNGIWQKEKGETNTEALVRCFRNMLDARMELYPLFADVTVDAGSLKKHGGGDVEDLIEQVARQLPKSV